MPWVSASCWSNDALLESGRQEESCPRILPPPQPPALLMLSQGKENGLGTTWIVTGTCLVTGQEALGWHEN